MLPNASDYLTDQLIPYIGNKRKLLGLIRRALQAADAPPGRFFDAFAGSGVVSRLAKTLGYQVAANDWEPYTEPINTTYIALNAPPPFEHLGGLSAALQQLNDLPGIRGYIATHYCPADDDHPDLDRERMFYTQHNGQRLDAMREQIETWTRQGLLNRDEQRTLLAPLIYQAAYCSNTSGVFKAFHRGWGGATRTAWYRIRSHLTLAEPLFFPSARSHRVYREDAHELAPQIECEVAYLDPPYNQHQYGSNYHLLNTVALWDKPPVEPTFLVNGKKENKSAIRKDWRRDRRSRYCYRESAASALAELVGRLRAQVILTSYSTDGLIDLDDLVTILGERGALRVVTQSYKRYRVSRQRYSHRPHNVEFVLITDLRRRPSVLSVKQVRDRLLSALGRLQEHPTADPRGSRPSLIG